MGAVGQRLDLHAGVVVVKLAVHPPTLGRKQIADGVAQGRLTAVANVQRASGVGRHKLHQKAFAVGALVAKVCALAQHFAHDLLLGRRLQTNIDKPWSGYFHGIHPGHKGRLRQHIGTQGVCQLTRVQLEWLGQLHGGRGGEVPVCGDLGRLERRLGTSAGE